MSRTGHRTYRRRRAHVLATTDVCYWCGRWLDPDIKWPHPHSATVDHIIPVSRPGGSNTSGELVASCWECNKGRGNRLGPPKPKQQPQRPKPEHARRW
jgi:5-methylcytosine-specific restriction endonuclease McrA